MNYLFDYERISKEFSERMSRHEDVEGVAFLGGVARGRADKYSDIDIAVFSKKKLPWLVTGEQETTEGYDLEIFNIPMEKGYDNWDEIKREAYQEAVVDYDRSGETAAFLSKALEYTDGYRNEKTAKLIFEIAWHGWIYTPFRDRCEKNYRWLLTEKLWLLRGEKNNAYYTARYSIDLFLELLFAVNRRWTPDYKWRYIRAKSLPWLPTNYDEDMDKLLFGEWSEKTWEGQRARFQRMLDETVKTAAEYLPEDWYSLI